ncbi:methyl-accepting chemotaxis protein [Rugamonas apoptosis]|uniref:Nitrate- and nitrite sensing domain-containing protein n=1 Tax=Rugamonas apoptosis TaxID=2758570 RepID=A0A7W2IKP2_9BURK|nr:methyl-accepting chemotaxis protein [Rugamonas apoptosis]MBA5688005.1 nitrate- and nitrite sensing domain-containing protein [Rugamonas apoptosis]
MNALALVNRLRLPHKFLILSLIAVILAAIPSYLYMREAAKSLDAYLAEQEGVPHVDEVLKTIQLTQQHRGLSALFLGQVAGVEGKRQAKQDEADRLYAKVDILVKRINDKGVTAAWDDARADWERLRTGVAGRTLTVPQSFAAHTALVPKLLKVNDLVGDYYGLSLDPDKDSYQLIQSMYYQLPYLTEELGKTRALGAGLLARHEATPEERVRLAGYIGRVIDRQGQAQTAFGKAAAANPDIESKLGAAMREASAAAVAFTKVANDEVVQAENLSYSPEQYVTLATQTIDLQFKANELAATEIAAMLKTKIADFYVTRWLMLGSMLALLALAGVVAWLISRSVTVPLQNAVTVAQSVARGDLVSDFDVGAPNEVGQMLRALKHMNDSLRTIVSDVRASIDNIGAATRDIASGNADVSARLEAQASSLEETASSMEQLTSTVRQNADNARQANALVVNASTVASRGGEVVSQVVQTMSEINASSHRIVDIIATIDGIAFQTNILALNAAVEAARAGEQGRGFAVVASEVRNLAQRSGAAAKEIKELIGQSVEKVDAGNRLADRAGQAMGEIVGSVERITAIMGEIATASAEQGSGIEQVNEAVTQMDDMTQQNAALVEQTAAASASLQEQAESLIASMSVFRLDDDGQRAVAAATSTRSTARAVAPVAGRQAKALSHS